MSEKQTNAFFRALTGVNKIAALACGYGLLVVSCLITIEIIGRKVFLFTMPGIDDIGGYMLAISSAAGASYALLNRAHTRVDIFLDRMPRNLQAALNILCLLSMAAFAVFAAWRCSIVLLESIEFQSTATNPLQTPLWQPQSLWLAGICLFAFTAASLAVHGLWLFGRDRLRLNRCYGPLNSTHEAEEEVEAIKARAAAAAKGEDA